jgi:hypothetical protein
MVDIENWDTESVNPPRKIKRIKFKIKRKPIDDIDFLNIKECSPFINGTYLVKMKSRCEPDWVSRYKKSDTYYDIISFYNREGFPRHIKKNITHFYLLKSHYDEAYIAYNFVNEILHKKDIQYIEQTINGWIYKKYFERLNCMFGAMLYDYFECYLKEEHYAKAILAFTERIDVPLRREFRKTFYKEKL